MDFACLPACLHATLACLVDESLNRESGMQKNQGRNRGIDSSESRTRESPGPCVRLTRRGLMFVIITLGIHESIIAKKKTAPLSAVHDRDVSFATKYGEV